MMVRKENLVLEAKRVFRVRGFCLSELNTQLFLFKESQVLLLASVLALWSLV